jgi:hypothetical protein
MFYFHFFPYEQAPSWPLTRYTVRVLSEFASNSRRYSRYFWVDSLLSFVAECRYPAYHLVMSAAALCIVYCKAARCYSNYSTKIPRIMYIKRESISPIYFISQSATLRLVDIEWRVSDSMYQ